MYAELLKTNIGKVNEMWFTGSGIEEAREDIIAAVDLRLGAPPS